MANHDSAEAAAAERARLQSIRLRQLTAVGSQAVAKFLDDLRLSPVMLEDDYHFRRHGSGVGVSTREEYLACLEDMLSEPGCAGSPACDSESAT